MSDEDAPTYSWKDTHEARKSEIDRKSAGKSLWAYIPGLVYVGAVILLSAVLGKEIAVLFAGDAPLLQIIGWGCVVVVGMSAIASFYGKGAVYKSRRQQVLGMFFWVIELFALTTGLLVAIANLYGYDGQILDVGRFFGFMSVVIAAFGWGIIRWASPEWAVTSSENKTKTDLAVTLAEIDSQFALSDEMIQIRMITARDKARRAALAEMNQLLLESEKINIKSIIDQPSTVTHKKDAPAAPSAMDSIKQRLDAALHPEPQPAAPMATMASDAPAPAQNGNGHGPAPLA